MTSTFDVYDTTLRDGAQQEGLNLSVADKLAIARQIDGLGVGYIEGGWPGANPKDTEFFRRAREELHLENATLAAFGATRRAGTAAADDPLVAALRDSGASRGELLLHQQAVFYAGNGHSPPEALEAWRAVRRERDRTYFAEARTAAGLPAHADGGEQASGYEAEAIAVVQAITGNEGRVLILDTANRRSLPFLDERAVVEVPCVVGRAGAIPTAIGAVPDHARALIETIKDVERTTIRAALEQSAELAIKALALHPLVPSVNVARSIFEQYATRHHDLAGRFGR